MTSMTLTWGSLPYGDRMTDDNMCGARYSSIAACNLAAGHAGDHVHNVTPDGGIQVVFPPSAMMAAPQADSMRE